jgi:hypothetical protein
VRLERSRQALAQAERALARLVDVEDDPDEFRAEFVACIGMVGRVSSILDEETRGHRTTAFGTWWQGQMTPLRQFLIDVRNAEFKRGEDRKNVHHHTHVYESVTVSDSATATVTRGGQVIENARSVPSSPVPAPAADPPSSHSMRWYFRGGTHDGEEVQPLLRHYLDHFRDVVIPEAERLTI